MLKLISLSFLYFTDFGILYLDCLSCSRSTPGVSVVCLGVLILLSPSQENLLRTFMLCASLKTNSSLLYKETFFLHFADKQKYRTTTC